MLESTRSGHDGRRSRQDLGHGLGVVVVGSQVVEVMIQRMVGSSSEDTHLAHRTAQHSPVTVGAGHQLGRPGQHRTAGSAQALGEGDPDQVERLGELGRGPIRGHRGVPEPSAVQIGGYSGL